MSEVDVFVQTHGEQWRNVIDNALKWLNEKEPSWKLSSPVDRSKFIAHVIEDASHNGQSDCSV